METILALLQSMQEPDWNDLRYFLVVAEEGSLSGAARKLDVNHSTVFRRIQSCESRLGTRLFERLRGGYAVTAAGDRLLAHARRVRAEIDQANRELAGQDVLLEGSVRITAPENIAFRYLPGYVRRIREQWPGIEIEIAVSGEDFNLSRREADIAVRATSKPPEHLVGRKVRDIGWGVYGAQSYLESAGVPETMAQLPGHRFIGADDTFLRLPAFRWMREHLPAGSVPLRCNSLNAMAALAAEGLGLVILPDDQAQPALRRLFGTVPDFRSQLWVLTHPDLRNVARIRSCMRFLAEALQSEQRIPGPALTVGTPGETT